MKIINPLSSVLFASVLASGCTTLKPETIVSPSEGDRRGCTQNCRARPSGNEI